MEKNRHVWRIWLIAFLAIIVIWCLSWVLIDYFINSNPSPLMTKEAARGVFGDKFGAVNALFSGLAFAGIIITISLQRNEIALQRIDIEEQSATNNQQRFENGFFHMLDIHQKIVENAEILSDKKQKAFLAFIAMLKENSLEFSTFNSLKRLSRTQMHNLAGSHVLSPDMLILLDTADISTITAMLQSNLGIIGQYLETDISYHKNIINAAYQKAHEKSKDALSHYFRNLYHIFRYIDQSAFIDNDAKMNYARIIRAQLSDGELVAILYNCLAVGKSDSDDSFEFGYPKMTKLVKKYDILQNINHKSVIHPIHLEILKLPCQDEQ